jgi:predicted ArsR family transcriptional regulator
LIDISGTRREILGEIKKSGETSISQLTKKLNIVTNAVRGHMVLLEKENLVTFRWLRQKKGRPLKIYKLSEDAEIYFTKKYDYLLNEIIKEIILLDGTEKLKFLTYDWEAWENAPIATKGSEKFQQILSSLALRWAGEIKEKLNLSGLPFDESMKRFTDYLNSEGYLTSLEKKANGYVLSNYNCIYRNTSRLYRDICGITPSIIKELTGAAVSIRTTIHDGSPCCILDIARP